jgi:hypothetical protein
MPDGRFCSWQLCEPLLRRNTHSLFSQYALQRESLALARGLEPHPITFKGILEMLASCELSLLGQEDEPIFLDYPHRFF